MIKRILGNSKGFTLVEMIIAVAIIGVIFIPITNFYIYNLKYFNLSNQQIEAQRQAQFAINSMVENAMGTKGLIAMESSAGTAVNIDTSTGTVEIKSISFKSLDYGTVLTYSLDEYNKLTLTTTVTDADGNTIETTTRDIAENISQIRVTPSNDSFSKCLGLKVEVTSSLRANGTKDVKNTVENEFYFRNK